MDGFLGNLTIEVSSIALALFLWATYARYMRILEKPGCADFQALLRDVSGNSKVQIIYGHALGRFLDGIDWFFDRWGYKVDMRASDGSERPPAWSANAYDRCLLLAVAYPVVSAFIAWGTFGHAGDLGTALGLIPMDNAPFRFLTLSGYGVALIALFFRVKKNGWQSVLFFIIAVLLFFLTAFGFLFLFNFYTLGAVGDVAFYLSFSLALSFAVAGAFAFAFAFVGVGVGVGVVVVAFAVPVAVPVAVAGAGAVPGAVAGAFAGAVLWLLVQARRWRVFGVFLLAFSVLALTAVYLGAAWAASTDQPTGGLTLLVVFGLLSLINAPFDWASLGWTRWLLRRNLGTSSALKRSQYSLADFAGACVLLVALALALVAGLELVNAQVRDGFGQDFVDVRGQLLAIQADPWAGGHVWIYFTLFSTFVPTLLHATLWCLSLVTVHGGVLRSWIHTGLTCHHSDGPGTQRFLAAALTLRWVVAIAAVAFGVVVLWWLFGTVLGLGEGFLHLLLWWQAVVASVF